MGDKMISAKRAATIVFETDKDKRDKMIDNLSAEDAKYMLKHSLTIIREGPTSDSIFMCCDAKAPDI
jgi:hypothetical protein